MNTRTFKFRNGEVVREKITGFTGTITGTVFYITGCNQYLITAEAKNESTPAKAKWYDEGRLEVIETNGETIDIVNEVSTYEENGPDLPAPGGKRGS